MRTFFLICAIFLMGCGANFIVELQNGYQLIVANSVDVSILDHSSRGVPANILELNTAKEFVFGKRENDQEIKRTTYFVLDTKLHVVDTNLTQDSMRGLLQQHGVNKEIALRRPTFFFNGLRNKD